METLTQQRYSFNKREPSNKKAETIAGLGFRRFSMSMQVYISESFL